MAGEAMKLRPYQDEAVTHIFERDRSLILAPVGAGKTAIALTAMREFLAGGYVKRWLVLAPLRVARSVWPAEAKKWAPGLRVGVATGAPKERLMVVRGDDPIVATNYENLQWLAEQGDLDFDGIVFDELTRLKNPSGLRFKALMKLLKPIQIRVGLTGSFTSNGLEDVFGQCKVVDESLLGRAKGAFQQQYFYLSNPYTYDWSPREGALEAVMERIKPATFVLEPGEYTDTLPPLHTIPVPVPMDLTMYNKMREDFVVQFSEGTAVALNAATVVQKLQQMSGGWVYETTKRPHPRIPDRFIVEQNPIVFSSHKFDAIDDIYQENQQAPTIVVYQYKEELEQLRQRFPFAATLDDDETIMRWNDGKIRMLLLHPKSAGHGLNLQHGGCRMIWMSTPWSLELYEQTVGRLHRSGQKHDVWNYVLQVPGTIDETIWTALHDKRSVSDMAQEALK